MQIRLRGAAWAAAVLAAASLTPAARAQGQGPPVVQAPAVTNIRVQTTVTVPDGGSALAGGYSEVAESRSEYGAPVLGKTPYLSRVFRNIGYGRTVVSGRVVVSVRVINLEEEEYRQTGYRSR
jgi:general secretion pathway protein D